MSSCARSARAPARPRPRGAARRPTAQADTETNDEKRKARYQETDAREDLLPGQPLSERSEGGSRADQENRTPGAPRRARRRARRASRRRARPPHASCAAPVWSPAASRALGALPLGSVRKAEAGRRRRRRARSRSARTSAPIARSAAPSSPKCRTASGSARSRAGISPINRGSHCAKGAAVRELVHGDRRLKYPMKLVDGQWTADLLGHGDQRDRRQAAGDPREVRRRIRSTGSARRSSPTKAPICSASSRPSGAPTTSTIRRASATRPPSPASPIPGATAR